MEGVNGGLLTLYIIVVIFIAIDCGKIAVKKGYSKGFGQALGLILGIIGWIILECMQDKSQNNSAQYQKPIGSNADELMKYKQLLDAGVISQAEFEQKKRELLR